MKKLGYLIPILLVVVLSVKAQTPTSSGTGTISGKLIDQITKEPVALANIRVLQQKDSTFVTGQASKADGSFSIPVKYGSYIVHISFLGYKDIYKNVQVTASNPTVQLGTLLFHPTEIVLSEVVIAAKAPEIRVKGDTLEFSADSYKVTESAVVEDLLKKMPGVEVDKDGKITVHGREIKKILVDGEEFFSDDPKVASKNLPAKMVEKLQVLDRRSELAQMTGFDDDEEETVINLVVRPGMKEGLMGNAFAGYGNKDRYEANAMVNYMKNKNQYTFLGSLNNTNNAGFSDLATSMFGGMGGRGMRGMFGGQNGVTTSGMGGMNFNTTFSEKLKLGGNVRFGSTDNNLISKTYTQNLLSGGNTFEDENEAGKNKSQNFNMDFRLEWKPDTLTQIIFRPNAGIFENRRTETGDFFTRNETNDTINSGDSEYYSEGDGKNIGARLDASRQLGKKGRVLSIQLRGGINDSENKGNNLSNTLYHGTKPDDIIDQRFTNTNNSKNWQGYVSYVEPIGRNNFIQLAYRYRRNISESDRDTRSKDAQGNYTVLDSAYSKRLENDFVNQQIEINFKAEREKYNYTLGFSAQPSSSKSKTFKGDDKIHDLSQNVVNYAPSAQFNYRWSRQNNLRIQYSGNTNQPSVNQLSPVVDVSDPLNITYGNPDLKPSFNHRLNIRYMNFIPEKSSSITFFGNAGYTFNDIVSSTFTDRETGRKETTYENVDGNWNANGRLNLNVPLRNIKFSIFSMTYGGYSQTNGFSNNESNLSRRTNLAQTLGLNYRSDIIDFGIRGNISYNNVRNTLEGQRDQEYFNYNASANTILYLPYDFSIETDISYNTNSGYSGGFEQEEWLWNASLQKQVFKQKNGTIRFKIYDILQQRSNISRSVTSNYIRDTTTNTLTSYFMFHFVYRFNIFKGGTTREDMMPGRGPGGGPGRGPGGGPGMF
jgi:hypothetical protein